MKKLEKIELNEFRELSTSELRLVRGGSESGSGECSSLNGTTCLNSVTCSWQTYYSGNYYSGTGHCQWMPNIPFCACSE